MSAEKLLRKHVILIHAYSLMSILQRKIVNVLLYEAIKNNNNFNHHNSIAVECCIPFSKLCKLIKFNSNNTSYLKESIDGLASLTIEWNILKDKIPTAISFLNLRILHGAPTFYHNNTINFSFHRVILDLVTHPLVYGTLDVELQSNFESKFSHALYENSTRFINLQKNKIIELNAFRKILGLPEDKFKNMRELNRNVILPSIEEVNDRADFIVNLKPVNNGRKIMGYEFLVKMKKKTIITDTPLVINKSIVLVEKIKEVFGKMSESVLGHILRNFSEKYIIEKMAYTKKYAKKEISGFYPIPYFISAIKYDYKFKEDTKVLEKNVDPHTLWAIKLKELRSDLSHWEKRLSHAITEKDEVQKETIKKIIFKCREKMSQHCLNELKLDEAV